ncbi:MAG TPA: pyruvate formate lyase family protein [Spirochaetota bacterium]|nr:pyruvate formate lyase family protein [Spirochaetota bacterium]
MQTVLNQPNESLSKFDFSYENNKKKTTETLHVLKIQRTCVHDGPGIRTTIFFQGCALRCAWCQNPESLSMQSVPGAPEYSISDILETVSRDKEYYASTGGGVTLSGGEPLLQNPDSLIALLKALRKAKIHVAAETSLFVPTKNIAKVAPYIDLFLVDLKLVGDETRHRELTQQKSALIHANIKKLITLKANIRFRMVIVPGLNDSERDIRAAARFLKAIKRPSIELLKYHNFYEDKAVKLGLVRDKLTITPEQGAAAMVRALDLFKSHGVDAAYQDLSSPRRRAEFPQRVYDIQNAIRESDYHLCFEVSKLKTEYYRKNGFDAPTPIHRSERLAHVLRNKEIIIYPDELLVGNFTSKRKAGQVWEEHYGTLFVSILHQINRQTPVAFKCSFRDKITFYTRIFPFWATRSLMGRVNKKISDLIRTVARSSEMSTGFNNNMAAIAHFIVNFDRVLELGTTGLIEEIRTIQREKPGNDQDFYRGAIIALEALAAFADRYADKLMEASILEADPARREELKAMAEICRHVPRNPARTYHEALQSMLFLHIALCIESYENAVSFGRLDQILHPYYQRDLKAGIITYDRAKELLALFIVKMDEVVLVNDGDTYLGLGRLFETMSTDQTVTAGGMGKDGKDATNDLTYMLLDICELQPYAVNMTARIHRNSPQEYLDRLAEIYINGAPMPALYNDELYIDTLTRHYDTSIRDARNYSIVGCVEPNASDEHFGNTDCANMNLALPFLQALKGHENDLWNIGVIDQLERMHTKFIEYNFKGKNPVSRLIRSVYAWARNRFIAMRTPAYKSPRNMDELLDRFQKRLNHLAQSILADHQKIEGVLREGFTTPLASSLFKSCVEQGKDAYHGGCRFNSSGIQGIAITDVADSLHAIDEVVYKKRRYSIDEVIEAIDANFEGEKNREIQSALLAVPKFGQDESPESVAWVNKTLQIYVNALNSVPNCPRDGIYTAGYYALNVNGVYGRKTPALPSGRLAGTPLANSVSPHHGMEHGDLLSSLNSVAGADFASYAPNGTTVTFTIDAALFQGAEGVRNLASIFSTFFKKGGMQFQPNVLNREILLDAYNNPEKYPFLLVRIAGYCAYFTQLSDELKKEIINRTCYS